MATLKLAKQPSERLFITFDFSDWLTNLPLDSIASATASVDDSELVIEPPIVNSPYVKLWYSAGLDSKQYKVTIIITTVNGVIKEIDFYVRVRNI